MPISLYIVFGFLSIYMLYSTYLFALNYLNINDWVILKKYLPPTQFKVLNISQTELSIIFDKLSNNPEITKEEIEKLKLDTAEYLSELANNPNSSLITQAFLPVVGIAASYAVRAAFGDVSWEFVFATAGIFAVIYLIANAIGRKFLTLTTSPISDFEDYALDKLNKRRALQGKKPVKIKKPEKLTDKDYPSHWILDLAYALPELAEKFKKLKEKNITLRDFLKKRQARLFFKSLAKKYPGIPVGAEGFWDSINNSKDFFNKWKEYPDIRFKPTPIDQVVNKNVDVEQEYQKLLKQNRLEDYVEQPDEISPSANTDPQKIQLDLITQKIALAEKEEKQKVEEEKEKEEKEKEESKKDNIKNFKYPWQL
jgi:hypothetical protein